MPHRSFTDSSGRLWHVWNVTPHTSERRLRARRHEIEELDGRRDGEDQRAVGDRRADPLRAEEGNRRSGMDRREEPARRGELDRRTGDDRRDAPRARVELPNGYAAGWLCFETDGEKRRLGPIPGEWATAESAELEALLGRAEPVRQRVARGRASGSIVLGKLAGES